MANISTEWFRIFGIFYDKFLFCFLLFFFGSFFISFDLCLSFVFSKFIQIRLFYFRDNADPMELLRKKEQNIISYGVVRVATRLPSLYMKLFIQHHHRFHQEQCIDRYIEVMLYQVVRQSYLNDITGIPHHYILKIVLDSKL